MNLPAIKKENLPGPGQAIGLVILLVAGGFAIRYFLKSGKEDRAAKKDIRDADKYIIKINKYSLWHRQIEPFEINLLTRAREIYDSFYNQFPPWDEDEARAIVAISDIPAEYIKTLAWLYNDRYSENLYEDFRKYLESEDFDKISYLF
jgi:hypothetical protein